MVEFVNFGLKGRLKRIRANHGLPPWERAAPAAHKRPYLGMSCPHWPLRRCVTFLVQSASGRSWGYAVPGVLDGALF